MTTKREFEKAREGAYTVDPLGESLKVSSVSYWKDFKWKFENATPGQVNAVYWDFLLPDGSRTSDESNYVLLESFREVVWGMLTDGGWWGKTLSVGSADSLGSGCRDLWQWMNFRGLRDLGDLSSRVIEKYLEDLPLLLLHRSDFYKLASAPVAGLDELDEVDEYESFGCGDTTEKSDGMQVDPEFSEGEGETAMQGENQAHTYSSSEAPENDGDHDEITYAQVSIRIFFIYFIYAQRERVMSRGLPCFDSVPFDGRKARDVVRTIAKFVTNRIPPLPDEVAYPFLAAAFAWVDDYAPDVLALQKIYLHHRKKILKKGHSRAFAKRIASEAVKNFSFRATAPDGKPWREGLDAFNLLPQGEVELAYRRVETIRYFIARARTAAIVLLQYTAGLRPNEICGLKGGWKKSTGLPKCVKIRTSKSGLVEMFFVEGLVSKGRDQPESADWLIGCRPSGSQFLPPAVRALILLEKLFSPWRALGKRRELVVGFTASRGLAWVPSSVGWYPAYALARDLKLFVRSEVSLADLPTESARGEDLTRYINSRGTCIIPSQGRKTFAAYILEARPVLLPALQQHFKHYNKATTESAYYPTEVRLRGEIDAVIASETIRFFVSVVQGKKLAGRMAELVSTYFRSDEFSGISDYAELTRRVTATIEMHGLRIYFSDHGNCFIHANPLASRCREASGTVDALNIAPDFRTRTPGMCSGCGCFVVDATHIGFWDQRFHSNSLIGAQAKARGREHEFAVHEARAEQAKKVLGYLGIALREVESNG